MRDETTGQFLKKHGDYGSAEYRCWSHMKARCGNPKHRQFKHYGGRGISVCDRWMDYDNFLSDMGRRPTPEHSLDRRENDKGYTPENCRWSTRVEQNRNNRGNHMLTHEGKTMCIMDWADHTGIRHTVIRVRIDRGWPVERALTEPRRNYPV